jgi:hypothetical protein
VFTSERKVIRLRFTKAAWKHKPCSILYFSDTKHSVYRYALLSLKLSILHFYVQQSDNAWTAADHFCVPEMYYYFNVEPCREEFASEKLRKFCLSRLHYTNWVWRIFFDEVVHNC